MPRIAALHIHPVKSCRRIEVDEVEVGRHGIVGDREWQVVDADGAFVSQRTHPELARVKPERTDAGVTLRCDGMPDLDVVRPPSVDRTATTFTGPVPVGDAGDDAAAWFSELLSAPSRLVAMTEGYERMFPVAASSFPDPTSGFARAVERASGFGLSLSDAAPILLINTASHLDLAAHASEPFGIERWRPNVVIDGADAWEEDTWRQLRIGDGTVDVALPWPRCTIPQVDQDSGGRHREPARVLKARRWCSSLDDVPDLLKLLLVGSAVFGVTGGAPEGTVLRVGDDVEVLERGPALLPAPLD
jgi:uncharacterized protein YcbX